MLRKRISLTMKLDAAPAARNASRDNKFEGASRDQRGARGGSFTSAASPGFGLGHGQCVCQVARPQKTMTLQALHLHAGPKALAHIREHGLCPEHIGVIPGAAGGPKGLILGPLDRFIFNQWLSQSSQSVDLVGASIGLGAWPQPVCKTQQALLSDLSTTTFTSITSHCRDRHASPQRK